MTARGVAGLGLPVVTVGAGIAGVACARVLSAAGMPVVGYDRGQRVGGRMALRHRDGRTVDVGASYLTARDEAFAAVVADWERRGLARPWTDTFHVGTPTGLTGTRPGPLRWAAPGGLQSLVADLARDLVVESAVEVTEVSPGPVVDGRPVRAAVLAMPGPQARDVLSDALAGAVAAVADADYLPALCLYAAWDERSWPELDGVFVQDSAVLTWIADDGRRRGDGAPVLVAHSGPELAARHLDDPGAAGPAMLAELCGVLGIGRSPRWLDVRRWSLARPVRPRAAAFHLDEDLVGLCGDGWCAPSRVEAAYLSGRALGLELARRLDEA